MAEIGIVRKFRAGVAPLAALCFVTAFPARAGEVYTPKPGGAVREAIFDAMRDADHDHDRVYVERYLKAQDGWAWLVADPQSRDGKNRYETESALIRLETIGKWTVVARPCAEADCDPKKEMARIRAENPHAPAAIFPHR